MLIYRVEDDFGGGPYNGTSSPGPFTSGWRKIVNGHEVHDPIHQPNPVDDLKITLIDRHYKFGFASVDQVIYWFGDEARHYLDGKGYRIARYEVPETAVIVGGHQVAYDWRKAQLVGREPIPITKSSGPKSSTKIDA